MHVVYFTFISFPLPSDPSFVSSHICPSPLEAACFWFLCLYWFTVNKLPFFSWSFLRQIQYPSIFYVLSSHQPDQLTLGFLMGSSRLKALIINSMRQVHSGVWLHDLSHLAVCHPAAVKWTSSKLFTAAKRINLERVSSHERATVQ